MDLTGLTFDTGNAELVGGLVLTGIAAIWGIRKAISMANR